MLQFANFGGGYILRKGMRDIEFCSLCTSSIFVAVTVCDVKNVAIAHMYVCI